MGPARPLASRLQRPGSSNRRQRRVEEAFRKQRATGAVSSRPKQTSTEAPKTLGLIHLSEDADALRPGHGILGYIDAPKGVGKSEEEEEEEWVSDATPNEQGSGSPNGEGFLAFSDEENVNAEMAERFAVFQKNEEQEVQKQLEEKFAHPPTLIPEYPSPWLVDHKLTNVAEQFSHEVKDFVAHMAPHPDEHQARINLVARVRGVVHRLWADSKTHVFGSFATGLYLPGADIDLVVTSNDSRLGTRSQLYRLADRIRRAGYADRVDVISRTRVPLVKFVDKSTEIPIDISFEQSNGLHAVQAIKRWMRDEAAVRPLATVIKLFLRRKRLNDVHSGYLGGYATICMVVSFLKNHKEVLAGRVDPMKNLGVLLVDFFLFYGREFDTNRLALRMTGDMEYVSKQVSVNLQSKHLNNLAIEDPNDPGNNICRASFNYDVVRKAFSGAADLLKQLSLDYSQMEGEERGSKSFLAPLILPGRKAAKPDTEFAKDFEEIVNRAPSISHSGSDASVKEEIVERLKEHRAKSKKDKKREKKKEKKLEKKRKRLKRQEDEQEDSKYQALNAKKTARPAPVK